MLSYKSYYCIHNKDETQRYKVYIFNEFALIRNCKTPKNTFLYTNLWTLFKENNVKYYWFNKWNKDTIIPNTSIHISESAPNITRKNFKQYFKNKKFNDEFENHLV